jgi:hypothetical protein
MHSKKIILVLDTETADLSGSVYDLGYVITDKSGTILAERNWLVKEIFTDASKMLGAFYAKKLFSHYAPMLDAGEIHLTPWADIVAAIRKDIADYSVNILAAYNLPFDIRAIRNTHASLGNADKILPFAIDQLCIWQFVCESKLNTRLYKNLARAQGWVSDAGNIRTGAEYAYRFCCGDWGFIEDHTALSDARIETAILARCFASRKTIPYNKKSAMPWRIVNES